MRLIKLLLCLLLIFSTALPVASGNNELTANRHQSLLSLLNRRDYKGAESLLSEVRKTDAELYRINNYEYLYARMLEKRNDLKNAAQSYQSVINDQSLLSEYALWHLAYIARNQRDLALEKDYLRKLITKYPDSLMADDAQRRLADSQFESGNYEAALSYYRGQSNRNSGSGREALGLVGLSYMKLKQDDSARSVFEQLIAGSKDDQALLAAQKLDELDRKQGRKASEAELLTRARIYIFNRAAADARNAFQAVIDRFPASKAIPEAMYAIGRSYYIEYDYQNAIKWYDRVYKEYPDSSEGEQGFYQVGHALQNLSRYPDAVKRYQDLIEKYPKSKWAGGAHLNAIDSLRSAGKYDEALDWCDRAMSRFGREATASTALFAKAKIYLVKGNYNLALSSFTELRNYNLVKTGPGGTNRTEVDFMRAFCLEKLGRYNEAIDAYLNFPVDRDSFFGNRATLRLEDLSSDKESKSLVAARLKSYQQSAKDALSAGNYLAAKNAANQALRLTKDDRTEQELIEILRQCYENLPTYRRFMDSNLASVGRNIFTSGGARDRSHRALANELIFLGLYDEGAPELRVGGDLIGQVDQQDANPAEVGAEDAEDNRSEVSNTDNGNANNRGENSENRLANSEVATAENNNLAFVNVSQRKRRVNSRPAPAKSRAAAKSARGNGNSRAASNGRGEWSYSIAVYLNRGSHANPAIRYGESTFSVLPDDFRLELVHRDIAELLYPAPYRDDMVKEAQRRNIDARFMLAIARQESRFNPSAKSASAARGLFQFIPATAEQIRQELKLNNFNQNDLYQPPTAVAFGAQYLGDLFDEFKENPYAVAASYNGGEQAVRRWIERSRNDDFDRFVIEIAYQESKDYVYKVLNNYWAYRALYRDDLVAR